MHATAAGSRNLEKKKVISGWEVTDNPALKKSDFWVESGAESSKKTSNFRLESDVTPARIKQFPAEKLHRSGWK